MLYFTPGPTRKAHTTTPHTPHTPTHPPHTPTHTIPLSTVTVFGYEVGAWHLVAIVTFPVSFLKQVVSVVQLIVASQNIGVLDANSRANKEHKQ